MTCPRQENSSGFARFSDDGAFEITVLNSREQLEACSTEWDAFVERSGSDIYFTSDWLLTWWDHYGQRREFYAFMIRMGQDIIAALPFAIEKKCPLHIKLARFMGADSTIPVFFPAIAKGHEKAVADIVINDLLYQQACDCISFSPLSEETPFAAAVRHQISSREARHNYEIARDDSASSHTLFHLPDDFESHLRSLAKQTRSNYRRDLRNLAAQFSLEHRIVQGLVADTRFNAFAALHQEQWRAAGRLGHFGDWPQSLSFNRALTRRLAAKGRVQFFELWGGDLLLSSQFCFILSDRCYWRLPARLTNPALEKLGLGRVGLAKMLEGLMNQNIKHVEAGPGQYEYKLRLGGKELHLRRLVVSRVTILPRWRTRILLVWADFIHFAYYRLWYLKLSHWLALNRGPLWRVWIRTRL